MKWIDRHALYLAWLFSLAGVFGSLYYGEVLQIEPCKLCWFQRIGMFPIALFLGIAIYQNEPKIALYCLPLALFGGLFALYQSLLQIFPALKVENLCGEGGVCTLSSYMPYLSLISFVLIGILILRNSKNR